MKKLRIIIGITILIFSLSLVSCKVRHSEPITGEALVVGDDRIKNGETIFMVHCQKCHPGGEGGLGPAINSNPAPAFIKRFQVRHGLGTMPAFKKEEISKNDLHDITRYLKALKKYHKNPSGIK